MSTQDSTDADMAAKPSTQSTELDQHEEYRLLADSIPVLAWIAHADGSIYWYNRRWYEYTGTALRDMEGWGWQSVHDPAKLPFVLARWQACIRDGRAFEMTFPLKGADGTFRPFLTRVVPLKDDAGRILRWFGTNTDVGEEIRAATALRDSEQRFRIATEAVSGILWTNSHEGEMLGQQPGWSGFTGQTPEEYSGYGWAAAIHLEDAQPTIDAWREAVSDSRLFAFEHRVRRHDGAYRLCSVRALPVRDADGTVREWVGVHTDITQQKQSADALIRSEKLAAVGRLASSIAHEINNPLEAVTNLLYLLLQSSLDEEQRAYCTTMMTELQHVSAIATHTLRFHRQSTNASNTRLDLLIQSVLTLFEGKIRNSGVEVVRKLSEYHSIHAFHGEIRQVLANLVGNAIDAMNSVPGGQRRLLLRTHRAHHPRTGTLGIAVTIADSGNGIAPEVLGHIFDPFFTTKGELGTGLGLWVSSEIVRKHHGEIRLRSRQGTGRHGTVARVFLPLMVTPLTPDDALSTARPDLHS